MLQSVTLQAPAKINYRLDVIGKRPDGYHELRMIMQRVNLCDEVSISLSATPGIRVVCGSAAVPDGEGNIAWKAARAMLELSESCLGVDIAIVKNIPVAAGLGGGSSDCAAVLMGLNELLGLALSTERLMEVAVGLGADVPFFIFQKTAIAEGIGEKLSPLLSAPSLWVVLVNPNVPVSTAWVYGNLQLTQKEPLATLPNSFDDITSICAVLSNDLESVTLPAFPVIGEIKERLVAMGAAGAMMSGSGPTVFGLFSDEAEACGARDRLLAQQPGWFTVAVETI